MGKLNDKVAIITGAGQGIGYAGALRLASEGASVVAVDIKMDGVDKLVKEIKDKGGRAISIQADVTNEDSVMEMVNKTVSEFGRIDILYNNAGATKKSDKGVVDMDLDTWNFAMDLVLKSVMLCCKHVIPIMIKNGGGSIINTSSGAGLVGDLSLSAYGAAKAGVINLTRYIATQHGKQNIRCNVVVPGVIVTEASTANVGPLFDLLESHALLPRNGKPEDIANAVVFLASDESGFMTGAEIVIDGGLTMHMPTFGDYMKTGLSI
jgi:NAD(P)-dependent dehydrogenase (short-subunit alcohol dehydrogenase family)